MNLKELKLRYLNEGAQIVVFKRDGEMLDSCDTFIPFSNLEGASLYDHFPLMESIQQQLKQLKFGEEDLIIEGVEYDFESKPGVFDFQFYAHPEDESLLVWMIVDKTTEYERMRELQQERNELRVKLESRFTSNGKV